jgi:radical SAM enzyme (TIGR01210 family)
MNDAWVLSQRGPKAALDPARAYATFWEEERGSDGRILPTATILLTNRECPFRCLMCDLWINTLDTTVPPGTVPTQIAQGLAALPPARQVKLYNAGSFFDPRAIPPEDDDDIAHMVGGFDLVVVESHPAFLTGAAGERCLAFQRRLRGRLEVAIGLETAHPDVLARLNKRMTLESFRQAARFVARHGIGLRVFVLLNPPYLREREAIAWACRSIDEAAACGAAVCTVIPTRGGNGALEALGQAFAQPRLPALEAVVEYGVSLGGPRVFADLWDVERFYDCDCGPRRAARLETINREQCVPARVECTCDDRV